MAAWFARRTGEDAVVLYDGVCGLCNRFVEFARAHGVHERMEFHSMHDRTGREMLASRYGEVVNRDTMYVVVRAGKADEAVLDKSTAALFVLGRLAWPWRYLYALRWLPRGVRDLAYELIQRNRRRNSTGCRIELERKGAVANEARTSEVRFLVCLAVVAVLSLVVAALFL